MSCQCQCQDGKTYLGTKLKYLLDIEGDGFDMDTEDFEVSFIGGTGDIDISKEQMVTDGKGKYYVLVDTNLLGVGVVKAIITAHIHDVDFPGEVRDEVYVIGKLTTVYEV